MICFVIDLAFNRGETIVEIPYNDTLAQGATGITVGSVFYPREAVMFVGASGSERLAKGLINSGTHGSWFRAQSYFVIYPSTVTPQGPRRSSDQVSKIVPASLAIVEFGEVTRTEPAGLVDFQGERP